MSMEALDVGGIRRLTPSDTRIFEGEFALMQCEVGGSTYRGVHAVRMFPVHYPNQYISLRYTTEEEKEKELGVIEHLDVFPEAAKALIERSLVRQYFEQIITGIRKIEYKHNLLHFQVQTTTGDKEFFMRWSYDRAEDYGVNGKVLLDAFDNRYIIADVTSLPAPDRLMFTSFIYW